MPATLSAWYTPAGFGALAARQAVLEGEFAVAAMRRLAEYIGTQSGSVTARFAFSHGDSGWIRLEVVLKSNLSVTCQRCLGPLELEIAERLEFGLAGESATADVLPDGIEAVMLDGDRLVPKQLVEEEMIIAVPLVPKHMPGHCTVDAGSLPEGIFADSGESGTN